MHNSGTVTDSYTLDAFGVKQATDVGTTPNRYRYGGAWGYASEATGLEQLGYRWYYIVFGMFLV